MSCIKYSQVYLRCRVCSISLFKLAFTCIIRRLHRDFKMSGTRAEKIKIVERAVKSYWPYYLAHLDRGAQGEGWCAEQELLGMRLAGNWNGVSV